MKLKINSKFRALSLPREFVSEMETMNRFYDPAPGAKLVDVQTFDYPFVILSWYPVYQLPWNRPRRVIHN